MLRPQRLLCLCLTTVSVLALAEYKLTEAPAGFSTPTLVNKPGSQSTSNGIAEPPGDTFGRDQQVFELRHDINTGLGPVFNATACAECHQNGVTGAGSQITELRAGHIGADGNFIAPTILIDNGRVSIPKRSIINDRAVCPEAQEHLPGTETIRTQRAVLSTLGDGFVEAVADETLLAIAAGQPGQSDGSIHGEAIELPILEAPGYTRIGRFGWKDQQPTVLSFAGDAYLNEMGVTNRLRPKDVTSVCKSGVDPNVIEDQPDELGLADIDHFAHFIRGTKAPPRDLFLAGTPEASSGEAIFKNIGCSICHFQTLTTLPPGTLINGGTYAVPEAIGNRIIHPFGDFLLHDVGTGDGIVQAGPSDTADKLRTVPLWGLHIRSRFMHDLRSFTLEDAIRRHAGEAERVTDRFENLSARDQNLLLTFLKSL